MLLAIARARGTHVAAAHWASTLADAHGTMVRAGHGRACSWVLCKALAQNINANCNAYIANVHIGLFSLGAPDVDRPGPGSGSNWPIAIYSYIYSGIYVSF